jgi:O-antigen ligase
MLQNPVAQRTPSWVLYRWFLFVCAMAVICCSALVVVVPAKESAVLLLVALILVFFVIWKPSLSAWHYLYLTSVLILPPFYVEGLGSDIPLFTSHIILLAGGIVFLSRYRSFHWQPDLFTQSSGGFLLALVLSLPFAFWLSGPSVGLASCLRFLLILQPFLIYLWLRGFRLVSTEQAFTKLLRVLLILGSITAVYGIIDFYFPVPLPHPFADQYIYLLGRSIRRAQGVFYEASSFGNLCAFFWSLCLVAMSSTIRRQLRLPGVVLGLLAGVFTVALFLSYSRGSWANGIVTLGVFLLLQRRFKLRLFLSAVILSTVFLFLLYQWSPDLVTNFAERRLGPLLELWSNPNEATSGRWQTWKMLFVFFGEHPWLLLFGIGYKSVSGTSLFGTNLIVDNGYLSLLFETGILGVISLFWLFGALFQGLFRASQSSSNLGRHYAAFLLAFWCGQMGQMLTGDILTYWRNLVVYYTLAASLLQPWESERVPSMFGALSSMGGGKDT